MFGSTETKYRGVDKTVGDTLRNLASLESLVGSAQAAIEALNAHASDEQIMMFTGIGGNTKQATTIFLPSKGGSVYEPSATFQTFAKYFPFFGHTVVRASDGSVTLVNTELRFGLSLNSGNLPHTGFFREATIVDRDFIAKKEVQEAFASTLWHINKMTGENKLPSGYEFDYGTY